MKLQVWTLLPLWDILDPELPGVGVDVHVGREPLVISVAGDSMGEQVDVSVPHPWHSSVFSHVKHSPLMKTFADKNSFKHEFKWESLAKVEF